MSRHHRKPYPCLLCNGEAYPLEEVGGWFIECGECGFLSVKCNTEAEAISAWNALPHGWMRVEEYEPPAGEHILISTSYQTSIFLGEFIHNPQGQILFKSENGGRRYIDPKDITYWMPIPPLPKETNEYSNEF